MLEYEISSKSGLLGGKAAATLRAKAESMEFDQVVCDKVQMGLLESVENDEVKDEAEDDGLLGAFRSMVVLRVAGKTTLSDDAGVLTGRLYLDNMREAAAEIVRNYTNVKTRGLMMSVFAAPIAEALTLDPSQVRITNIAPNTDASMGQAGRLADGKVRNFLNKAAPSFLRWFEQSTDMDDDAFWEVKTAQSIDAAPIRKEEGEDDEDGTGSGDSPKPGNDPDSGSPGDGGIGDINSPSDILNGLA